MWDWNGLMDVTLAVRQWLRRQYRLIWQFTWQDAEYDKTCGSQSKRTWIKHNVIKCKLTTGTTPQKWRILLLEKLHNKLKTCIDDTRQFTTARRPQATSDAIVRKRFFHYYFVIFRHWLKTIAFLESVNFSMCDYIKFSIFVMVTWPLFGTLQGPISAKCLFTASPDKQKSQLQSLSFPSVPLVWGKTVFCRLCAG